MRLNFLRQLFLAAAVAFGCGPAPALHAADTLRWNRKAKTLDADIESVDIQRVLKRLSSQTGWEVFVEPGMQKPVSVRFKNAAPGEALKFLLGGLNFALLPQTNNSARLFIYTASMSAATQRLAAERDKNDYAIPNELIVALKTGNRKTAEALTAELGGKLIGGVDGMKTYRLQFPDEASAQAAREKLAQRGGIGQVDSNYVVELPTEVSDTPVSVSGSFNLRPAVSTDSSKVVVGLIDTKVQALPEGMNEFLLPGLKTGSGDFQDVGQLSHGTSMAETILRSLSNGAEEGARSTVRILPVDVYGANPDSTTFDVAQGVYAAINAGATIINMSMGGDGDSFMLQQLIQDAHSRGVLFFGAAGNIPTTTPTYPAAYPEVVAVTAGDRRGNIAPYANRGNFVDVIAPGTGVVHHAGDTYLVSGTSTATAWVSGAAAQLRASGQPSSRVEMLIREQLRLRPGAAVP